jgi:hypothetical protein
MIHALAMALAASVLGIDAGWEPLPDGGLEYIVQIEPDALGILANEQDISSDIPPGLDIRRIRVTVGTARLPRHAPLDASGTAAADSAAIDSAPLLQSADGARLDQEPAAAPNDAAPPAADPADTEPQHLANAAPATFRSAVQQTASQRPELPRTAAADERPWLPLILTAVALLVSLGANVYLAWVAWESRHRCRDLLDRLRQSPAPA